MLKIGAFYRKRAKAIRKIKNICKKEGYAFESKPTLHRQKDVVVKTPNDTFAVHMCSVFRFSKDIAIFENDRQMTVETQKGGKVMSTNPLVYKSVSGVPLHKDGRFSVTKQQAYVKNYKCIDIKNNANVEATREILLVCPAMDEVMLKEKDEVVLAGNGMRIGRYEYFSLNAFCDLLRTQS